MSDIHRDINDLDEIKNLRKRKSEIDIINTDATKVAFTPDNIIPSLVEISTNEIHSTEQTHLTEEERQFFSQPRFIVVDKDLTAPPASPANGALYIVGVGGSGDWNAQDNNIANKDDGTWTFLTAVEGFSAYLLDENKWYTYTGAAWVDDDTLITALKLDVITNPEDGDINWTFGNKHLHITFVNPDTEGGLILEGLGNFSGKSIVHLHQHTGNVIAEAWLRTVEWEDAQIVPERWSNDAGTTFFKFQVAALGADRLLTYPDKDITFAIDTVAEVESVITAELVNGQSIDNAIDALITTHKNLASDHHTKYLNSEAIAAVAGNANTFTQNQIIERTNALLQIIATSAGIPTLQLKSTGNRSWNIKTVATGLSFDDVDGGVTSLLLTEGGGSKIVGTVGFFNTTPQAQSSAYTPTNVNADRAFDADATTLDEIADVLGTLIIDLQTYGLIG